MEIQFSRMTLTSDKQANWPLALKEEQENKNSGKQRNYALHYDFATDQ